ncbi:MAG TPA: ABC transporter permease [Pyrinomonadaceae bacterium]|nr:ABC transporter permease [Pyrinomonadaceae bacterium]
MRKFLAVTKREYRKIVFSWTFLVGTLLAPLIAAMFAVVPAIIFSIKGDVQKIAVVDQSGQVVGRLKENLSPEKVRERAFEAAKESLENIDASQEERLKTGARQIGGSFEFVEYDAGEKSIDQIHRELNGLIQEKQIDSYLIIPQNVDSIDAEVEFYSRKAGDFVSNNALEKALNEAILSQRLADSNISEAKLKELSKKIELEAKPINERGEEKEDGGGYGAALIIGILIYVTLAIYGQVIMGAVVEEKETRIAEILFSSAKPFDLMMGKLVGVGLAALSQLAIWIFSALALLAFGLTSLNAAGLPLSMPNITVLSVLYFFIFFLLGFFVFATIFALIGSMVTTTQEGGQFSFVPVVILLIGFYCTFPIMRDSNSAFAFWVSIAPFIAPLTMPVRIAIETPPFWQIALAILSNGLAIFGLVWLASRVYRVGMLMYGKRATIPEVWKWIWQS